MAEVIVYHFWDLVVTTLTFPFGALSDSTSFGGSQLLCCKNSDSLSCQSFPSWILDENVTLASSLTETSWEILSHNYLAKLLLNFLIHRNCNAASFRVICYVIHTTAEARGGRHPSLDEYKQFAVRSKGIRTLWTLKISQLKLHFRTKPHAKKKLLRMQSKLSRTGTVKGKRVQLKTGEVTRDRRFQKVSFHSVFLKQIIFEA